VHFSPIAAACLAAAVLTACTASSTGDGRVAVVDAADPAPLPATAPPPAPRPAWAVDPQNAPLSGESLREIRDRPDLLADRRLPTVDLLPPPPDGRFTSTVGPITPGIRHRMGETWSPQCPVGLDDLRYVTVVFRGFDGRPHTGDIVVHATAVDTVVEVFRQLYSADFPIEEMRLATTADRYAPPTGDANTTVGYNCRPARGQTRWSAHAYGQAVDINPFQNPWVRRGSITPELGAAYADRTNVRPGMLMPDGPAVRAFTEAGWFWGGDWTSSKDYMHFSADGS
jgi:hypothetical protein